ncbi:hypothetical protein [Mucilaginibacter antarcticus]|uniref:hypothetical protein n=1 Tax=Mucilaginibacter antarcticus TaxID=1855725 RepID=UPI00363DE308
MLFTDADCKPDSTNWITRMAAHFKGDVQLVLGYSPYFKTGGFLNSLIRFETVKTAVNYLSAALNGDPYMGIGRNMAYTKTLFFLTKVSLRTCTFCLATMTCLLIKTALPAILP